MRICDAAVLHYRVTRKSMVALAITDPARYKRLLDAMPAMLLASAYERAQHEPVAPCMRRLLAALDAGNPTPTPMPPAQSHVVQSTTLPPYHQLYQPAPTPHMAQATPEPLPEPMVYTEPAVDIDEYRRLKALSDKLGPNMPEDDSEALDLLRGLLKGMGYDPDRDF